MGFMSQQQNRTRTLSWFALPTLLHMPPQKQACVCVFVVRANVLAQTGKGVFMGWLRLVGCLKLQVSFGKEPYKRDDILQKRPVILRSLLIVATPYANQHKEQREARAGGSFADLPGYFTFNFFFVVMPPHNQPSKCSKNAHKWCAVLVFGLLFHNTASTPLTAGTHTSGAQFVRSKEETWNKSRGMQNVFPQHWWQNHPEVLGDLPTSPYTLRKDSIFWFWRHNSNKWNQKSNI